VKKERKVKQKKKVPHLHQQQPLPDRKVFRMIMKKYMKIKLMLHQVIIDKLQKIKKMDIPK